MAQDYLAIQGSATPSERAFSSGGLTGAKHLNHLNVDVFESLQLLKSVYQNGHISAVDDATQHLDALIAVLEDDIDDDLPSLASLHLLNEIHHIEIFTVWFIVQTTREPEPDPWSSPKFGG